ncbi:hypothetical protein Dfer_1945 [Dyadobacter fermentans DSM 18053]|uniref:Uncharacterized protein n=1 Tax=Dyadobacter fermentans (strain ATCC 700827 / DSM 18053 / CIP 107007 / KCTC 52180 / NS114) TaxID=471854 RepID=C6VW38_DYAFD|nr:hypothetical protein Dfer_1945 [Dyadobacter fermentans DSM 18053]
MSSLDDFVDDLDQFLYCSGGGYQVEKLALYE